MASKDNPEYTVYAVANGVKYDLTPITEAITITDQKKQMAKSVVLELANIKLGDTWMSSILMPRDRIFIYADDDFRAQRAKTDYDGATLEQLNKEEKRRKQYYEFYTGQTWGAPEHYDLMINTSNMPLEDVADFIIDYIKKNPRG